MKNGMNELVPMDELYWHQESNTYSVISQGETDDLIEACFRVGMKKTDEIFKVVKEYEKVRAGVLLFNQFLCGRIGIYDFDKEGSPIFEPTRIQQEKQLEFMVFDDRESASDFGEVSEYEGKFVVCDHEASFDVFVVYRAIMEFCSKWGVDLLNGEDPEEKSISGDPDVVSDMAKRGWRVSEVEVEDGCVRIAATLIGSWLRTKY